MTQNIKKKIISIQIKLAQDHNDHSNDNRRQCVMLTAPVDSGVACLMRCRPNKEFGKKALKTLLNRLRMRKAASADISPPDPTYKVVYLGNVLTGWARGENCVEKPLSTLWRNYTQSSRPDVRMQLTVSGNGLRATTRDHGLTEYWAHRISYCAAPSTFPRLFCWVYRHEGRRLRHELRCHAVLCSSASVARKLSTQLRSSLIQALREFKRDKISRQNARLSLHNACYENPSMPRRKILLSTGSQNYRPPLERSKSAPKLTIIEENIREEEEEDIFDKNRINNQSQKLAPHLRQFKHSDSASLVLDRRLTDSAYKNLLSRLPPLHSNRRTDEDVQNSTESDLDKIHEESNNNSNETSSQNNSAPAPFSKRNFSLRKCKTRNSSRSLKNIPVVNNFEEDSDELEAISLENLSLDIRDIDSESKRIIEELLAENTNNNIENNQNDDSSEVPPWLDSDEGSLSSGCDSASTAPSDVEQNSQPRSSIDDENCELLNEIFDYINSEKAEESQQPQVDFKYGGCVLARVRSLERMSTTNNGIRTFTNFIPETEEVSLIPVGEMSNDFSSLRIFKKKLESNHEQIKEQQDDGLGETEENDSSCSDESGYDESLESSNIPQKELTV